MKRLVSSTFVIRSGRAAFASLALLLWSSAAWAVTQVTTCGLQVQGDAELAGDLDCSAYSGDALKLDGTLHLNGFTMRGNVSYSSSVVSCPTDCTIIGPGIVREGYHGVVAAGEVVLQDVTLDSNAHVGASGDQVSASGVTVTANGDSGLAGSVLDVRDSSFSGNVTAIRCYVDVFPHPRGGFCTVRDSIISNNTGAGVVAGTRLTIKGTSVTGNQGGGVQARNLRMSNCVFHGNNGGIVAQSARIRDSHVTDNQDNAIRLSVYRLGMGFKLVLVDSTVTGNAGSAIRNQEPTGVRLVVRGSSLTGNCIAPGGLDCADILSCHVPTIEDSTCETSHDLCNPGTTWGVCSLD